MLPGAIGLDIHRFPSRLPYLDTRLDDGDRCRLSHVSSLHIETIALDSRRNDEGDTGGGLVWNFSLSFSFFEGSLSGRKTRFVFVDTHRR